MAKRKKNIHIEDFGTSKSKFAVYSDLSIWEIEQIEGISDVSSIMRDEGYLVIIVDKRYSISEVLNEVRRLAD